MKWTVAITTAPRREPTLARCVQSIKDAGFAEAELIISAEPKTQAVEGLTFHENKQRLGVWFNFIQSCRLALETGAHLILTAQDDLEVYHPNTRELCEYFFVTGHEGPLSMYTPYAYSHRGQTRGQNKLPPGIYPIMTEKLWSAVGYAWRREDLQMLVDHPLVPEWRSFLGNAKTPADAVNSDAAIGKILKSRRLYAWFPTPSLGRHVAKFSTIPGHGPNDLSRNRDAGYVVDPKETLASQLRLRSCHGSEHEPSASDRDDEHRQESV